MTMMTLHYSGKIVICEKDNDKDDIIFFKFKSSKINFNHFN